jgi:hypothetical protein
MSHSSHSSVTSPLKVKGGQALKEPQGISSSLGDIGPVFIDRPHIDPSINRLF